MILDRQEVLRAIAFIAPVIPEGNESGMDCLFIRAESDKLILTGGGQFAAKKVVLVRPISTEEAAKDQKKATTPETFMILKGSLMSFETLLKKHKKKCKKLAKNDASYLYIDLDNQELESFGVSIHYKQPSYQFKDLEPRFQVKQEATTESIIMSGDMANMMKGFLKSSQVKAVYCAKDKAKLIHFSQKSTEYEAVFICPPEDDDDE